MSDHTITVSDGTDFFRIPIADLQEACADGFYVPALNGKTIVSNGETMFEIPLDDLVDAESDGFHDALANESGLISQAMIQLGLASTDADESPAFQFSEPLSSSPRSKSPRSKSTRSKSTRSRKEQENVFQQIDAVSEPGQSNAVEGSARSKFLFGTQHFGGKNTWQVILANAGLHGLIVLLLAMIMLPTPEFEMFMEITSAFEPKDPVELDFEAVELQQPVELKADTAAAEVPNQFDIESPDMIEMDISDIELSIPDTPVLSDSANGPPTTNSKSEMGGRSKAGRAAVVAKRGGNAASETAVTKGLVWVAHHQYPDGGWSFDHSQGECKGQCSQPGNLVANCRNAATGMALLAMLGAGNTPFEGDFQKEVQAGVAFLLKNSIAVGAGLDMRGQHSPNTGMYTHAIATTALCEILAMTQHEFDEAKSDRARNKINSERFVLMKQIRPAAQASIAFIVNAQHAPSGGWGYDPATDGDTSILGWQVMALKSAAHAKIPFPSSTIVAANKFLNSVQTEDGWFGYRAPGKTLSTTAIGMIARMLSGMARNNSLLKQGIAHLNARGPDFGNMYYNYYATQVMMHYGGAEWNNWNAVMRDHLVKTQIQEGHAIGSWDVADTHGARGGRLYMTCLCTMTLEVYYRHLPLYGEPDAAGAEMEEAASK